MNFPKPDAVSLCNFYGQPYKIVDDGIILDPNFEAAHITRIAATYDMWRGESKITKIAVNKKCAESLIVCLESIAKTISKSERKVFGLDQYGGGFHFRPIRGVNGKLTVNKLSLHAYGAAIDLAPALNPLGAYYRPEKMMMPHQVVSIFTSNGWTWGGDFKTRPDGMHFQATS